MGTRTRRRGDCDGRGGVGLWIRASPNSSQVTAPGKDTKNHPPSPPSTCQTHRRNNTLKGQRPPQKTGHSLWNGLHLPLRATLPSLLILLGIPGNLGSEAPPQGLLLASPGPTHWSQTSVVAERGRQRLSALPFHPPRLQTHVSLVPPAETFSMSFMAVSPVPQMAPGT